MEFSFDIVSKVNTQEVTNAVDQALREISTRYDFKNSKSNITFENDELILFADDDYKLKSIIEILIKRFASRNVPVKNLRYKPVESALGGSLRQRISVQQGIPQEIAKVIVKTIKERKFKAQASIQADQIRVSGKSKDELQSIIALLSGADFGINLQFINYR